MILNSISFDFSAIDEFGITLAVVGYLTVFITLVVMYNIYSLIPKIIDFFVRQKLRKQGKFKAAEKDSLHISGEVSAAIAMALNLYFGEIHDEESNVLTFKEKNRDYSPWNSKIYSVNDYYKFRG
jgi:Na+-transporting methylmalonyl-CoA/oxaloacetate decarboxylase gamma subunit